MAVTWNYSSCHHSYFTSTSSLTQNASVLFHSIRVSFIQFNWTTFSTHREISSGEEIWKSTHLQIHIYLKYVSFYFHKRLLRKKLFTKSETKGYNLNFILFQPFKRESIQIRNTHFFLFCIWCANILAASQFFHFSKWKILVDDFSNELSHF